MLRGPDGNCSLGDEAQRAKHREQWLERVGRELELAETVPPDRAPDQLAEDLDRLVEISAENDLLSARDTLDIGGRVRAIKLKVYEAHINFLLALVASEGQAECGELLRRVQDAMNV